MRYAVIGGSGAVGSLFAERLRESGEVEVLDLATGFDATAPDRELDADVVVVALPEQVALDAVKALSLEPGTLLVDTLSVKSGVVEAVRATGLEAVSVNPMFAPSLPVRGRPIAAVVVRDGPRARDFLRLLGSWGARVVEVTAPEHDRLAAASQALTHAAVLGFGLGLAELDVDADALTAVAPPPHRTLLALLARIAGGTPEVYWDVQAANPHAPQARAALANGMRRVADVVENGDEAAFADLLDELRGFLGDGLAHHRELCERIFEGMEEK
ncbi:prephenate dehydrogenase dimerization domain-containing protein [Lentzea flaviverrucosa]|uniref:Prephenate dehydrogenase n=1 Tax=Lentzea flaviverrucosa TaxID=200379 RepID=A0A1H9MBL6_9PSEU|nr:prephenate dehydrogenase dimerization domain-containing protein [Lentzea flaviverrucosa]RDI30985.1 prephenate dehydrogenase [Lentzea flaviverrucosa]SER21088.1 prephenate dehydrogenase [Lentzea flaviverrucosa]